MSGNASRLTLGVCALLCAACAHAGRGETTVILAGSVCSGVPQLTASEPQLAAASGTSEALVAYATPSKLVVYDLQAGRARLQIPAKLRSRPQLLRDLVVAVVEQDGQNKLVAYDLQTGQQRAAYPVPRASWLGAVQVGDNLIFTSSSLSFRPSERGSTVTALDARTGAPQWEKNVPYALSRPTAAAGRVYLISDHADVWALQADSGGSLGCSRLGSEPVEWLQADGDKLLLGTDSARAVQLTQTTPSELGRLQLKGATLPGQPQLQPSAYQSIPAERSAYGRVALATRLEVAADAPSVAGDRYFYAFYKHLFAFDAQGQLQWVHKLEADSVELRATAQAARVVTESGQVLWFDPQTGAVLSQLQLPDRPTSADSAVASPIGNKAAPAVPLQSELRAMAMDTDARLLPSRKLAVSALAALAEPDASRDLLDVYIEPSAPKELQNHVARVLAERTRGSEHLVAALAGDYNFLTGAPPPPLAAIVPGLVTNNEQRAVPRLVDRLFDPDTRLDELHLLVQAITKLGGRDAKKPLAEFLALYHADSSLTDDASALLAAAQALVPEAPAAAQKPHAEWLALEALSKDPSTLPALKDRLVSLLATAAPAPAQAVADAEPSPEPEREQPIRERLSDATISNVFSAHAAELHECIAAELARNAGLRALRFHFVIESTGKPSRFSVWPQRAELVECLQPKLDQLQFPAFTRGRRLASYTLALRGDATRDEDASAPENSKPFWFVAQLRGVGAQTPADRAPWWKNQNPLFVSVEEPTKPAEQIEAKQAPVESQAKPAPAAAGSDVKPQSEPAAPKAEDKPAADQWWLPGTAQ
ncbi:MAG TPA: PQQ-binding-like beta-propeller repeat protein [Polyangiales bacterium]|nr:PQQ-binding-like beta-propeller repeat protein [Polyangiales bacterium]